jgi:hypothetical protein
MIEKTCDGYISELERLMSMSKCRILLIVPLILAACAGTEPPKQAGQDDQRVAQVYSPLPPTLTPAQEAEKADARRAYVTCLYAAARYADKNGQAVDIAAALIAPMCYPQFVRFEAASTAGMESRAKRNFDWAGDKRQIEIASDAIRRERGVTMSAAQP